MKPGYIFPGFDPAHIPLALRAVPNWLLWRYAWKRNHLGEIKETKIPYRPAQPTRYASVPDSAEWESFELAFGVATMLAGGPRECGIGFAFGGGCGLVGVDLDDVIRPDGVLIEEAAEIVTRLASFTEVTPSGKGLHVILAGELPFAGRNKLIEAVETTADGGENNDAWKVETYQSLRFLTCTGRHLPGTPTDVQRNQDGLDWLVSTYFPEPERGYADAEPTNLSDERLLEIARSAANGRAFSALYDDGDLSAHGGDHSAADFALLSHLAFYSGCDAAVMKRLFLQSALGQREKASRDDYLDRSIERACASQTATYISTDVPEGGNWATALL